MSKRLMLSVATAAAVLAGFVSTASAVDLKTKRGYRELGGMIAVRVESSIANNDDAERVSGGTFILSPTFGYFFMDGLELLTQFNLELGFGEIHQSAVEDGPDDPTTLGFDLGLRYVVTLGSPVRPYLGAMVGMQFNIQDDSKAGGVKVKGETLKHFVLTVPVGILVPLFNDFVALDVGVRLRALFTLEDEDEFPGETNRIEVPIGYLGVTGFW